MKSINEHGESLSQAARIAGFAFVFSKFVVVVANFGISFRLSIPDNAVDTARNIMANETLFRINIACNLVYAATIVVLLCALYQIFRSVSRMLALVSALFWMIVALMWSVAALNMLGALRLLGNASYLSVFPTQQLQTLARLYLSTGYDTYYTGLPFWGLASTIGSYLLYRSRYVPRALAGFGLCASAWCVFCAFAFIAFPHFDAIIDVWWFDMPIFLFEVALGLWLLFKGLRPTELATSAEQVIP